MSDANAYAAKMRNHQWRSHDTLDEVWSRRLGNHLGESFIGKADMLVAQTPYPWSGVTELAMATSSGATLLESKVHGLVGAIASFAPPAPGQASHAEPYRPWMAPMITVDGGS